MGRKTIEHTKLPVEDFDCRALVVQTGWETAAEDYMIRLFRPVWNKETKIIQGFGKHGDAPTTRKNKVSSWLLAFLPDDGARLLTPVWASNSNKQSRFSGQAMPILKVLGKSRAA